MNDPGSSKGDGGPTSADLRRRSLSFGAAADLYDRIRPSYPPEAVRWMLGDEPLRVVDLGAGTGILSRVLASLRHDVIAVEPDEEMRAKLAATSPGVRVLAGSAEAIPLESESVDAVTAGQAYHWFAPEQAHAEIARVLKPGGVFAPIWNMRDESVAWVVELSRLVSTADGAAAREDAGIDFGPRFRPPQRGEFRHATAQTADTLVALVQSRSLYLTADDATKRSMEAAVRDLTSRLPTTFELPYVTIAYRAERA